MENKPEIITELYEVKFVKPEQKNMVQGAVDLINHFNKLGLMLPVTPEHYFNIASKGLLAVAENGIGQIIGTAAYTQFYPNDVWEFGGWAVTEGLQHHGIGMKLINKLFKEHPYAKTIAFGNKNSGPILESLGAKVIKDHSVLPKEAFALCATCPNKPKVGCCDTIYNLAPVIVAIASRDFTMRQFDRLIYGIGGNQWGPFEGWDKDPEDWK